MKMVIFQQSRFLALVSNGERLAELSAAAADSQDAATLQVLKTMDSIEFKTQQLQTSMQTLYTESGIQDFYKGLLDIGKVIIDSFTSMPKFMNMPIAALVRFGMAFKDLAHVAIATIKLVQDNILRERRTLTERITDLERQLTDSDRRMNEQRVENNRRANEQIARDNQAAAAGTTPSPGGMLPAKGMSKGSIASIALSGASLALGGVASGFKGKNDQTSQFTGGVLSSLGSAASFAATGGMLSGGNPVGFAGGALVGLAVGALSNLDVLLDSIDNKLKRVMAEAEEKSNEALKARSEGKELDSSIKKLKELEKHQHDSTEAYNEYIQAMGNLAEKYPDLIDSYTNSGDAIVKAGDAEKKLKEIREKTAEATKKAAIAEYAQALAKEEKNKEDKADAINDVANQSYTVLFGERKFTLKYSDMMSQIALRMGSIPFVKGETYESDLGMSKEEALPLFTNLWNPEYLKKYLDENPDILNKLEGAESSYSQFILSIKKALDDIDSSFKDSTIKNRNLTNKVLKSGFSLHAQSLLELEDDTALSHLENVNKIITESLYKGYHGTTEEELTAYLNDESTEATQELIGNLKTIVNNVLATDTKQKEFNDLIKNAGNYTQVEFGKKLDEFFKDVGKDNYQKEIDLIKGISFESAFDLDKFNKAIEARSTKDNPNKITASIIDGLGSNEYKAILEVYDNIDKLAGKTLSVEKANSLYKKYISLWENSNKEIEPEEKDAIQRALSGISNLSVEEITKAINSIEKSGFTSEASQGIVTDLKELLGLLPKTINTEIESYKKIVSDTASDYEKALSNASKGMDHKTASELAAKMKVKISDFTLENGKFYTNDYVGIYNAYYEELEAQKSIVDTLIAESITNAKEIFESNRSLDDWEDIELGDRNLVRADLEEIQKSINSGVDFEKAIKDYYNGQLKEIEAAEKYLLQQRANSALSNDLKAFLEMQFIFVEDKVTDPVEATIKKIIAGNIESGLQEFSSALLQAYGNVAKNTYDLAIKAIGGEGQTVQVTSANKALLTELGFLGANGENLQIGETAYLSGKKNSFVYAKRVKDSIKNSALSLDQQKQLLDSISSAQQEVYNNFDSLVSKQSSGFKGVQDIQSYLNSLSTIYKDYEVTIKGNTFKLSELDFEKSTRYDESLNAYFLSGNALIAQMAVMHDELISAYEKGSDEYKVALAGVQQNINSLANNINFKDFVDSEFNGEASAAEQKIRQSIEDYNSAVKAFHEELGIENILKTENIINALREGGLRGVNAAQQVAETQGKTLSKSDVEAIYRKPVEEIFNLAESIEKGIGTVISASELNLLEGFGENPEERIFRLGEVELQRIGESEDWVVTRAGDLTTAYDELLGKLSESTSNTIVDITRLSVSKLTDADKAKNRTINLLKNSLEISYEELGKIFTDTGRALTEEIIDKLANDAKVITKLGNGAVRIDDFLGFAEALDLDLDLFSSKDFVSAFKSYNDGLISLNNRAEKAIADEIKTVFNAKPGDWLNFSELDIALRQKEESIRIEFLATLDSYGGKLEDGILQLREDADILRIATVLKDLAKEDGLILSKDFEELGNAIDDFLTSLTNSISAGIKGTLSKSDASALRKTINNTFKFDISFEETSEGMRLTNESAQNLYYTIKNIDAIQGNILFNELRTSLESADGACKNISTTLANIKRLQEDINKASGDERKILKQRLSLYQDIARAQMSTAEQYDFMGRKLSGGMQGPLNYWDSVGKMFKTLNEAVYGGKSGKGEEGYIGVQDFYNIVTELNNMAAISGTSITFLGQKLDGDLETAANLIQKGFSALSNVEGEGTKISLQKLGESFGIGADSLLDNVEGGVKGIAEANIKMLDAQIQMLEGIVALEKLGDIDLNKNGIFDISDIYETIDGEVNTDKFNKSFDDIRSSILKANEKNKDFQKTLDTFYINSVSLRDLLTKSAKELNDAGLSSDIIVKVIGAIREKFNSGELELDGSNLNQIISEAIGDSANITLNNGEFIVAVGANGFEIDLSNIDPEEFKKKTGKDLKEILEKVNKDPTELTIEDSFAVGVLTGELDVKLDSKGEPVYIAGEKKYYTREEALAEVAFKKVGWDQKVSLSKNGNIITTKQVYGDLNVDLEYDVNTKEVIFKDENGNKGNSLDELVTQISHLDKESPDYKEKLHNKKLELGIDIVADIQVDSAKFASLTREKYEKARKQIAEGFKSKKEINDFQLEYGINFEYIEKDNDGVEVLQKTYEQLGDIFKIDPGTSDFVTQMEEVKEVLEQVGETDFSTAADALSSMADSLKAIAESDFGQLLKVFTAMQGNNGSAGVQTGGDATNLITNLNTVVEEIRKVFEGFSDSVTSAKENVDEILEAIKNLDTEIKLTINKDDIVRQVARLSLPSKTIKLYGDVDDITNKIEGLQKSVIVDVKAGAVSVAASSNANSSTLTKNSTDHTSKGRAKAKGTLMGELGPELYVTNGSYYIAGQNGAEFIDLPDDAIVFNHLQTKKLFNGDFAGHGSPIVSEQRSTSYATGNVNGGAALASASEALNSLKQIRAMWQAMIDASMKDLGSQAGRGGSGGGGGKDQQDAAGFIADLERWYNLLRQIAKLEEKISYEQKLQAKITSDTVNRNGSALYSSYKRELDYLDQEIAKNMELSDLQKSYYEARRRDLSNSIFGKIFTFNEEGLMQYNDNAILANGQRGGLFALAELNSQNPDNSPRYSAEEQYNLLSAWGFADYLKYDDSGKEIVYDEESKNSGEFYTNTIQAFWDKVDGWKEELDELYDSYNSKLEDILDNEASRNKILQAIIDNQLSVEDSVVKAIEDREQAIIDALQDERDAVEKNNQKFLEGLNEQLNRERDMYQRQQENDELISLRRQLAILQRSGGSASQIRNLQEQINTQERDKYFNAQQDQIDAIEKASNVQIERLDAQIELMTETLEYQKEHGLLWNEVYEIMNKSESEIADFIMSNGKEWMAKSSLQIDNDLNTLRGEIGQWIAYRKDQDKKSGDMSNSWNNYTAGVSNRYGSVWTPENVAAAMAAFNAEYNQSSDPNRAAAAANAIFEGRLEAYMATQPRTPQEYKVAGSTIPSPSSGGSGSGGGSGGSSSSSSGKTTTTVAEIPAPNASSGGQYTVSYLVTSTGRTVTKQFDTAAEAQEYRNKIIQSAQYQSGQIKTAAYNAPSSTTSSTSTTTGGTHGYKITQYGKVVQESGPRYVTREAAQAAAKAIVAKLPGGKYTTYDRGGMVEEDQLALVHAGEAVLTAKQTETLRNAVLNTHNKSSVISLLMNWRDSMERVINNATDGVGADGITIENATVEMNVGSIANDYDARRAGSEALNEMLRIARQTKVQSVRR